MAKEENLFENGKQPDADKSAGKAEKLKALRAAMDKIEKDFGKGSIMKLGDENIQNIEVIHTGSIGLDAALGVGGYPKGRVIEIYGPESSGKTTLAIHVGKSQTISSQDGWYHTCRFHHHLVSQLFSAS